MYKGACNECPATSLPGGMPQGHGTNVAGIVGASGDNGVGVAGMNWKASGLHACLLCSGTLMAARTFFW